MLAFFTFADDVERLKPPKRGFFSSFLCCWRRNRTKTNQNGTSIDGSTTPPPLPDQQRYLLPQVRHSDMHKKCMVIDLDETLVHSSFKVSEIGRRKSVYIYYMYIYGQNKVYAPKSRQCHCASFMSVYAYIYVKVAFQILICLP